jgi:putative SOS response-associated peptidase YedK
MCGRFTLRTSAKDLAEMPNPRPRYNIAPTQPVAAVRPSLKDGHRELVMLDWGLIPPWAEDSNVGYSTINVRAETVPGRVLARLRRGVRLGEVLGVFRG